jgi:bacteriorhodopsin
MQTPTEHAQGNGVPPESKSARDAAVRSTLFWLGVAGVTAALTYVVIRAATRRPPADPTTQRIEALIDEANRLLRALEEQK